MTSRPPSTSATRRRILDAAVELWQQEPPSVLFGGFSVARLAKAAGVTRATFYSYWPSSADYLDDLLEHLADLDPREFDESVSQAVRTVEFASHELTTPFLAGCDAQLQSVIDDPALRVRLGFLSKMDDPDVARRLAERYRSLEARQWGVTSRMLHSWGREVRPPIEPHQLQALHAGLQEMLAARHVLDPESMPVQIYGYVALVLLLLLTRRIDDPRSVDDILGVADTWPAIGLQLLAQQDADAASRRQTLEPGMILDMTVRARSLLGALAWEDLHLADVGRSIGGNEELAMRAFSSKAGLGVSILALSTTERLKELDPTGDPLTDLRAMLEIVRDELEMRPAITQSILILFARETRFPAQTHMTWSPVPILADQIVRAIEAGQLTDEVEPTGLTWTLLRVILLDSAPGLRSRWSGPDAGELVLRGAGAPPLPPALDDSTD
jgi:AcrR family transcriptional regulator